MALVFLIFVGFCAGFVYLLFFAKLLDVRNVRITGNETVPRENLASAVDEWLGSDFFKITRRSNIVFLPLAKLSSKISSRFPLLEEVRADRQFPHSLNISVAERKPRGIWCLTASSDCFYFDKSGVAYAKNGASSGFLMAIIDDERKRKIEIGSPVESGEWLGSVFLARDALAEKGINITKFIIPADSFDELRAQTAQGWVVLFGISTNIARQINSLTDFFKQKMTPEKISKLQYVDLRIQDRIYYK